MRIYGLLCAASLQPLLSAVAVRTAGFDIYNRLNTVAKFVHSVAKFMLPILAFGVFYGFGTSLPHVWFLVCAMSGVAPFWTFW
jgi:hypothetical protein